MGGLLPITLKLNGKKIGTLKSHEETEIEIPNNDMEMQATQYGTSSNKITIDDGDTVMIKSSIMSHMVMGILFSFIVLSVLFSNIVFNHTWPYTTITILLVLLGLIIQHYKIEVIDKAEWR
ncbi:hypothetical protein ACFOLA_00870 [Salinicoccus hispanicus]